MLSEVKQRGECSEQFTMDTTTQQCGNRHHKPAVQILLFALMVAAAMTLNSSLVEAITHPGDIQALKEVSDTSMIMRVALFSEVYS